MYLNANNELVFESAFVSDDNTVVEMEDKYSDLPPEVFNTLPIEIKVGGRECFQESLLGDGVITSVTDHGLLFQLFNKKQVSTEQVVQKVRDEYKAYCFTQALNFLNKEDKFCSSLLCRIYHSGYSVYPIFN